MKSLIIGHLYKIIYIYFYIKNIEIYKFKHKALRSWKTLIQSNVFKHLDKFRLYSKILKLKIVKYPHNIYYSSSYCSFPHWSLTIQVFICSHLELKGRFSVDGKVVLLQCEEGEVFTLAPCSERWWKCVTWIVQELQIVWHDVLLPFWFIMQAYNPW